MCLIISKPAGKIIPAWIIKSAMSYNQDGVGIMYAENGVTQIRKWLDIKPGKLERKLSRLNDKEVAIHFRMATHGRTDASNVHPFPVLGQSWLMHNGILHKHTPADRKHSAVSDTRLFIQDWLNPLIAISADGTIDIEELNKEIAGNALLIMANNGEMRRYGCGWNEYEGLQFSNEYAWDSPNWSTGWDINEGYGSYTGTNGTGYKLGSYSRYNSHYAPAARRTGVPGATLYSAMNTGVPDTSKYQEEETCDDIILSDLQILSDDLDLTDDNAIALNDGVHYSELLSGTLDVDEFLLRIGAETRLNLYVQLVKRGSITS